MARTSHRPYRRRRARVLSAERLWCHLCGEEIDKSLRWPHPLSATADHITPVAAGGRNDGPLAPAHKRCNEQRGAKGLRAYDEYRATRAAAQAAAARLSEEEQSAPRFRW